MNSKLSDKKVLECLMEEKVLGGGTGGKTDDATAVALQNDKVEHIDRESF